MHRAKETPTIVLTLGQPLIVTTSRIQSQHLASYILHTYPDDLSQFSVPVPVPVSVPVLRDFQLPTDNHSHVQRMHD